MKPNHKDVERRKEIVNRGKHNQILSDIDQMKRALQSETFYGPYELILIGKSEKDLERKLRRLEKDFQS